MLQTIVVYSVLTILMYIVSQSAYNKKKWSIFIGAIVVYAIVFGVRYGVGMDYFSYLYAYEYMDGSVMNKEPAFPIIISILRSFDAHYSVFFGLIAFAQLFLTSFVVKNSPKVWIYFLLTFMLCGQWLVYGNGLRQEMSFAVFAFSLCFIKQENKIRDYIIVLLLVFCATLFHNSASLLFIVAPLLLYIPEWTKNVKIQFVIWAIALLIPSQNFITGFFDRIGNVVEFLNYSRYIDGTKDAEEQMFRSVELGLGFYITQIINFINLFYSNKVKEHFKETTPVLSIYNLYYLGLIWGNLFGGSLILNRINYYFYQFQFIFSAFTIVYLLRYNRKIAYISLVCYLLLFAATLYRAETNTALFKFFWEI